MCSVCMCVCVCVCPAEVIRVQVKAALEQDWSQVSESDPYAQAALLLRGLLHGSKRASHKKGTGALECILAAPQVRR